MKFGKNAGLMMNQPELRNEQRGVGKVGRKGSVEGMTLEQPLEQAGMYKTEKEGRAFQVKMHNGPNGQQYMIHRVMICSFDWIPNGPGPRLDSFCTASLIPWMIREPQLLPFLTHKQGQHILGPQQNLLTERITRKLFSKFTQNLNPKPKSLKIRSHF